MFDLYFTFFQKIQFKLDNNKSIINKRITTRGTSTFHSQSGVTLKPIWQHCYCFCPTESNVSSLAVDAVVQQPSQLDVSWLTEEDPGNCSRNFSVTWFSLSDVEVREASTAATEYTIEDLEAFTSYNVCVTTCLSDAFDVYPMCDVNQTVEDCEWLGLGRGSNYRTVYEVFCGLSQSSQSAN